MNPINVPTPDFAIKQEDVQPDPAPQTRKRAHPFGEDPFSEHEQSVIRQKLDVSLSRNDTLQRPGPGGIRITYIEGWRVIHCANQIFGFNGWSSKIVSLDLRYVEESRGRYSACVSASVCVTLRDGSSREDRGGGIAENTRSKGDAILKAEKEAVTDATKRALKNFGLRLGLSLYDRQHVREMNRPQPRDSTESATRVPVNQVQTPVQTRPPAQNSSRFPQKPPSASPVTPPQAQAFQKVKNQNTVSSSVSPKTSIDSALAAKVAANRQQQEEALLREQALQRARANQSAAVSTALAVNGFQNGQALQADTVDQMAARHLGSVTANFQRAGQPVPSNAFSAGLSAAHTSAHLQAPTNPTSRAANQALPIQNSGLAVQQQFALKHRQFAMRGNVNASVANSNQRRNPSTSVRPSSSCSSRTRSVGTSAGLGVDTGVTVAHGVDTEPNIPLDATGPGGISMKQTEIDELSAIALADF